MIPVTGSDLSVDNYFERIGTDLVRLRCPEVAEFRTDEDRPSLNTKVQTLLRICGRTQANIAARMSEEHVYDFDGKGNVQILAGPGSAEHFRDNLLKRLGEVFLNLDWHLRAGVPPNQMMREFRAFETLYHELEDIFGQLPPFVSVPYIVLRSRLGLAGHV